MRQVDEEIDEELLDEEILNEMMEEEDRKSDLMWEKISGRARRKKKDHGKEAKTNAMRMLGKSKNTL